jgi:CDP-diacylglycerol--glycerol-3-phosphate 3-phosphatidyltransferase
LPQGAPNDIDHTVSSFDPRIDNRSPQKLASSLICLAWIEWYTEFDLQILQVKVSIIRCAWHQLPVQKGITFMLSKYGRSLLSYPLNASARRLHSLGVTPNGISLVGFLLTVVAAGLLAIGELMWGGIILLVASSCDMLDGSLARYTDQVSKFGAFLDSTLDRYSESITLLGLTFFYASQQESQLHLLLIFLALIGSWMVSYTRARAEGLQIECKGGFLQRPERIAILIAGLILNWMAPVLWVLAILTNVTALQRIYEVYIRTLPSNQKRTATE